MYIDLSEYYIKEITDIPAGEIRHILDALLEQVLHPYGRQYIENNQFKMSVLKSDYYKDTRLYQLDQLQNGFMITIPLRELRNVKVKLLRLNDNRFMHRYTKKKLQDWHDDGYTTSYLRETFHDELYSFLEDGIRQATRNWTDEKLDAPNIESESVTEAYKTVYDTYQFIDERIIHSYLESLRTKFFDVPKNDSKDYARYVDFSQKSITGEYQDLSAMERLLISIPFNENGAQEDAVRTISELRTLLYSMPTSYQKDNLVDVTTEHDYYLRLKLGFLSHLREWTFSENQPKHANVSFEENIGRNAPVVISLQNSRGLITSDIVSFIKKYDEFSLENVMFTFHFASYVAEHPEQIELMRIIHKHHGLIRLYDSEKSLTTYMDNTEKVIKLIEEHNTADKIESPKVMTYWDFESMLKNLTETGTHVDSFPKVVIQNTGKYFIGQDLEPLEKYQLPIDNNPYKLFEIRTIWSRLKYIHALVDSYTSE